MLGVPIQINSSTQYKLAHQVDAAFYNGDEWAGDFTLELDKYHRTFSTGDNFKFKAISLSSVTYSSAADGFLGIAPY